MTSPRRRLDPSLTRSSAMRPASLAATEAGFADHVAVGSDAGAAPAAAPGPEMGVATAVRTGTARPRRSPIAMPDEDDQCSQAQRQVAEQRAAQCR